MCGMCCRCGDVLYATMDAGNCPWKVYDVCLKQARWRR